MRTMAVKLCALVVILLVAPLVKAADPIFRAGAAVADITPQKWPVELIGSFERRDAMRAWDPLSARALVLDDGQTQLGIVIVDSCFCPRSLFDEAKRRAQEITGIKPDHLLMAATHTHTAPPSKDRRDNKADPDYVEHLTRGIVSALQQAHANLAPAHIGFGSAQVPEEVHNRRWYLQPGTMPVNPFGETTDQVKMNPPRGSKILDRPSGPIDPEVAFLSVKTPNGRPIALLANYSLHYVGGQPAAGVSADYFGEFAKQLAAKLFPEGQVDALPAFVGIMSNGTSGNINNINFREPQPAKPPFQQMQFVAGRVAERVSEKLPNVDYRPYMSLGAAQSELTLKIRKPTEEQIARARRFLDEPDAKKLPPLAKSYANRTLELVDRPETETIVMQALRIGEIGITAIPCETFVETGLRLKQDSPLKPNFTIELANGHYGYLPTPDHHRLGGYETWLGTNILEVEASDKIEAELLKLLSELKTRASAAR